MSSKNDAEEPSKALKDNECARVEALIANGADANQIDTEGTRLLQCDAKIGGLLLRCACCDENVDFARLLLEECPDIVNSTMTEEDGRWTPLHIVAQSGSVDCIELLLRRGANMEAVGSDGSTPLHIAARNGQLLAMKCLLEKEARGTATDNKGRLPLHDACFKGHVDVACFLLEKYPDTVNSTTKEEDGRWTPLHLAAQSGSVDCLRVLLECSADINERSAKDVTSSHTAAGNDRAEATTFLLNKGAVMMRSSNGYLSLHNAAIGGNVECIGLLLKYTDDVNATTSEEYTAVHLAILHGHCKALQMLLEHGTSVTIGNIDNRLPVHLAVLSPRAKEKDRAEALRCLLDKYPQLVDVPAEGPIDERRFT